MNKSISKYNAAVTHGNTKVGNVRYYQKGGNTYTRSATNSYVNDPRTARQMRQRLLHGSKVRLWAILKPALLKCYVKSGAQSDFNIFMKLNKNVGVFYTKDESAAGACTAMPLQIASGNGLQAILNTYVGGASRQLKTDISIGEDLTIGNLTTVGQLTAAILANNPGRFKEGDEIAFISLLQGSWYTQDEMEVPSVSMNKYRVVLKVSDSRILSQLVSLDGFHSIDGYLGTATGMPEGCFGYLHTRNENGSLKTAQSFLCDANEDYYDEWRTDEVFEIAAESYGKGDDIFADPNSEAEGDVPSPQGNYTVSVAVAVGQSGYGTVSGGGSYPAGATATIAASPATGYHFVKWSDNNTSQSRNIVVNDDIMLVATFAADAPAGSVTVQLSSANANQGKVQIGNGTIGATAVANVQSGQTVTIKGIPESGYSFLKWSDDNESWERQITPTENTTLTASFEAE